MSNRIELEKSFILDEENEKRIQEKIKQEGFKLVSEEIEEDTYFSDKELNFVKNRVCLRTRKINDDHLELTYKPKSTEETEKFGKKEVNIELNVKDYEDVKYIIKQLGYIEYVSFKKYRTTYSKNVNGYVNDYTWIKFMKQWTGYSPTVIDAAAFAEIDEVKQMPSYPDDGSIAIINDIVVVKF